MTNVALSLSGLAAQFTAFSQNSPALSAMDIGQTTEKAMLFAAGQTAVDIGVSSTVTQSAMKVISAMKTAKLVTVFLVSIAIVAFGGSLMETVGFRNVTRQVLAQHTIVVPTDFADQEADASTTSVTTYRFQEIFSSSEFHSLGAENLLTRWSLRPDSSTPAGHEILYDKLEIRVSVTETSPDSMSQTFAENITGPETLVYDGPWSAKTQSVGPAAGPKEFDMHIDFTKSFRYSPSEGNLLFDWRSTGGSRPIGIDLVGSPSSAGRAMGTSDGNIDSPVANGRFAGPAPAQLTFVPESSTAGLAAFGLTGMLACLRRRTLLSHV